MNKFEKSDRIKYIRALERFAKSAISLLKRDDFNMKIFATRIEKNYEILKRIEPTNLDQPYTKALQDFVNAILNEESREILLKSANMLEKLKNGKNYKKEKHKNDIFKEFL